MNLQLANLDSTKRETEEAIYAIAEIQLLSIKTPEQI